MNRISFEIPGRPVPKARPRVTKTGHAYTPKSTQDYEKAVRLSWYKAAGRYKYPQGTPLSVAIIAYFQIPKNTPKKRIAETLAQPYTSRPDLDNVAKAILDALNGVAYDDDAQIVRLVTEKHRAIEPRVMVFISPVEVDHGI